MAYPHFYQSQNVHMAFTKSVAKKYKGEIMMSCSQGSEGNGCCSPLDKIFQESFCGNFKGILSNTNPLWEAPRLNATTFDSDYFHGTFEVFNHGPSDVTFSVTPGIDPITVNPGNSISISVKNPTQFIINAPILADNGKYCITLYKRIRA